MSNEADAVRGLIVPGTLWEDLLRHLTASAPWEGVGLLGGRAEGGWVKAQTFYPGTNVDRSPTRYTMEPVEVLTAFRDMETTGQSFVGIVHSHPATPPVPSPTDVREAYYPNAVLVIVSFASGEPSARCWCARADGTHGATAMTEVPLMIEPRGRPPGSGTGAMR